MTKRQVNHAAQPAAVDIKLKSRLIPPLRSTASFLRCLCFLHLVDPVQWSRPTACSLHWNDITGIATAFYWMYFALLRLPTYWSWLMYTAKYAHLLKHHAMWISSFPRGIAHHTANLSRVLISGHGFHIIHLIGALVGAILWWWCCLAAFVFSSRYWNTSMQGFLREMCNVASWWINWSYACLWSIITFSGSSEHIFKWLPTWRIWSEKWCSRCIFARLKFNSSTRCCAVSESICVLSWSTWKCIAATEWYFQAG